VGVSPDTRLLFSMPAKGRNVRESVDGSSAHDIYQENAPTVKGPLRKTRTSSHQYATPEKMSSKSVSQPVVPGA
jgi:hypothetical protein